MKTLNLKKTLLATLVFFAMFITNVSAGNGVVNSNDEVCNDEVVAAAKVATPDCAVTDLQVINYLYAHGYSRVRVLYWDSQCSAICDTANPYNTIVFTSGTQIVGSADIQP